MKYENAKDILPSELIAEIQKYAAGKLLYIPQKEEAKSWGSLSGARQKLLARNQRIYNEYRDGKGIGELADMYFLSVDSIRKIVYGSNDRWIPFQPTIECAMQYHTVGLDEEWLRTFYVKKFGDNSFPKQWICDGLVKIPLRLISGVEDVLELYHENLDAKHAAEELPILLRFCDGKFIFMGSKENLEQLKARRINAYPAYIFVEEKSEYTSYVENYGKQFHQICF